MDNSNCPKKSCNVATFFLVLFLLLFLACLGYLIYIKYFDTSNCSECQPCIPIDKQKNSPEGSYKDDGSTSFDVPVLGVYQGSATIEFPETEGMVPVTSCATYCTNVGAGSGTIKGTAPLCGKHCDAGDRYFFNSDADCTTGNACVVADEDYTDYGKKCWTGDKICCCDGPATNNNQATLNLSIKHANKNVLNLQNCPVTFISKGNNKYSITGSENDCLENALKKATPVNVTYDDLTYYPERDTVTLPVTAKYGLISKTLTFTILNVDNK